MLYQKSRAKNIISDKQQLKGVVHDAIGRMSAVVGRTLGPGGRPVIIERDGLSPLVTKDGVTVARSLGVDKSEANIIIEAAKEICINTAKQAGDGTTTAIVLANWLVEFGQQFMDSNPKYNPQRLVSDLQEAYDAVIVPYLKEYAIKVASPEQLKNVATISANGDLKVAEAVVQAVMNAGDDGTVLIEEGQGNMMKVETAEGYVITTGLKDIGSIGPIFINDKAGQQCKMDNGVVFLYDGTVNDIKVPMAIQAAYEGTEFYGSPIMVLAHGFADNVLEAFAKQTKSGVSVVPVKTPMSGLPNSRSLFLLDMSAYTGGTVYDPGTVDKFMTEDRQTGFGVFKSAKVNMYETVINCEVNVEAINERIVELKAIGDAAFSEMDRMFVRAAIGKLTGGLSTIWVGGASELEIREKKDRVEDAVEAVRSAIAEGVIPGGCMVHLKLQQELSNHPDKKDSWNILINALGEPFNLLMENCGEDPAMIRQLLGMNLTAGDPGLPSVVFDANTHKLDDPFKAGIIEPAKVCRVSIGNALSVASLLITLGGLVVVPRDSQMEMQMELSKNAFKDMMSAGVQE
jgi:chaperonin GroEL